MYMYIYLFIFVSYLESYTTSKNHSYVCTYIYIYIYSIRFICLFLNKYIYIYIYIYQLYKLVIYMYDRSAMVGGRVRRGGAAIQGLPLPSHRISKVAWGFSPHTTFKRSHAPHTPFPVQP